MSGGVSGVCHAVLIGVVLCGFLRMLRCVQRVTVRDVGVVRALLMIPCIVVLGRFAVMFGGVLVMFRRFGVVFRSLVSHGRDASVA